MNYLTIDVLLGKVINGIDRTEDSLTFHLDDGSRYQLYHSQDCCEEVIIESIVGDLYDLLNSPILQAEERTSQENPRHKYDECFLWTFYSLATIKGYVDIRFYGTSNCNYSESVDFIKLC